MLAPHDPVLPTLPDVLDGGTVGSLLSAAVGGAAVAAQPRYVRYKPANKAMVLHDVVVDGIHTVAVLTVAGLRDLRKVARAAPALTPAARARCVVPEPVMFVAEAAVLVEWYPARAALPGLAVDRAVLATLDETLGPGEPTLVSYKPEKRAVLRWGGAYLKAYIDGGEHAQAVRGLLNSAAIDAARAPAPLLTISELRVTAQEALDGTAVSPLDTDAMHALGAVLARLQAVEPAPSLPPFTPARHLDIAGATAIHVGQLLPDLQEPVDALLERLRAAAPANGPLVVAHGDLHLDQALLMGGDIALLDFDHLCLADPAHDAATVAAHLITGAPGDLDAAAVVVDALCDGMGGHPPGLVWHLAVAILRRATYPFRLVRRDWPERMRETVRVADQLASQGALLRDTATA